MTEIFLKYPNQETKWKNLLNCTPLKLGIYVYQRHLMKVKKKERIDIFWVGVFCYPLELWSKKMFSMVKNT